MSRAVDASVRLPRAFAALALASTAALVPACICSRPDASGTKDLGSEAVAAAKSLTLDHDGLQRDLAALTTTPHVFGTPRQGEIITWLAGRLQQVGTTVHREEFTASVPNPAAAEGASGPVAFTVDRAGTNLWAMDVTRADAPCVVAIASHFDTKDVPGASYLGANDSGSSTAALVGIVAELKKRGAASLGTTCDVVGAFFDGEEAVLFNWDDGERRHPAKIVDHTYGSRYAAGRLTTCTYRNAPSHCLPADLGGKPLVGLVLMDMIGSPSVRISRDANSTPALVALAAKAAKDLGTPDLYLTTAHGIEDDHMPYLEHGVPALDLIDFEHLSHWHAAGDDVATLSADSMDQASRLAVAVAVALAR